MSTETPVTNIMEIDAAFRDEAPPPKPRPLREDHGIPAFLTQSAATYPLEIDGALPMIVLCRALAAHGLSIINHRNRLVVTARPSTFQQ